MLLAFTLETKHECATKKRYGRDLEITLQNGAEERGVALYFGWARSLVMSSVGLVVESSIMHRAGSAGK